MGRGNWIAGISYATLGKQIQADKTLRAALPNIQDDPQLLSGALFYLGVANYNIARSTHDKVLLKQALDFSQKAANMPGPYAQNASQNVYAIKNELTNFR
jgi:hypothetical protein